MGGMDQGCGTQTGKSMVTGRFTFNITVSSMEPLTGHPAIRPDVDQSRRVGDPECLNNVSHDETLNIKAKGPLIGI